jgi:hypothetical protein
MNFNDINFKARLISYLHLGVNKLIRAILNVTSDLCFTFFGLKINFIMKVVNLFTYI